MMQILHANMMEKSQLIILLLCCVVPSIVTLTFTKMPESVVVVQNSPTTLQCETSPQNATILWRKGRRELKYEDGVHLDGKNLVIDKVTSRHTGRPYRCVGVQSGEIIESKYARIRLAYIHNMTMEKNIIMKPPLSESRLKDAPFSAQCLPPEGLPKPEMWWDHNRYELWDFANMTITINPQPNEGSYTCFARNIAGIRSISLGMDIYEKLKFMPAPVNRQLEPGSNAKFYCKAEGSTPSIVKWTRIDIPFSKLPPHIRDDDAVLHFNRVIYTDTGTFTCVATNPQEIINATIDVTGKNTVNATVVVTTIFICVVITVIVLICCLLSSRRNENRQKRRHKKHTEGTADAENNDGGADMELQDLSGLEINHDLIASQEFSRKKLSNVMLLAENSDGGADMELKDRSGLKINHDLTASEENTEFIKNANLNKLLFSRKKLSTVMLLGHGEYGEVFLAKAEGLVGESTESVVMVKALEDKSENIIAEFNKERSMYVKMKHENVGTVLGLCHDTKPHYMIMDYTDWGDLKQFLLATRPEEVSKAPKQSPLSVPQNLMICQQVAVGMEYLSKQFIHKDLAARNCLISSSLKIKISCPRLSLDTYSQEYYNHESRIVPLRWAPTEAIMENNWSTKSDIWSFGVFVWEVFNQAELPYSSMPNEDVLQKLQAGELKLSISEDAPESLAKLLERCWSKNPNDRPSFTEAVAAYVELSVAVEI